MRDLIKIANECMRELDSLNIKYNKNVKFISNSRAKSRWGQCKSTPSGFVISISTTLLDDRCDIKGLKNTVIHELLHTCEGCMNHGAEWKRLASKVNSAYGYNIKRCNSVNEKGLSESQKQEIVKEKELKAVYIIECKCCKQRYVRNRLSKVVINPDKYRCGACGGNLVRIR